nr:growth hormone-regulated TBC protein 1 isoform X4 [Halichoerus grypus]XP_035927294.1 growth hormone-regulated TBC protein 1 isoform X4 [Halichoerus grypus]
MNRTFPDNIKFRKSADPCLQKTLYNVLLAYGRHNQGVGYCQGMNFIAGYLILITKSEEESFWLLDALVGRILPDYYSPAMLGLKTDQEVLGELVRTKLPAVAALMDGHGVLWTLVVSRWFICLFVDILPVETVLRIWDCLFNEGSKIIFRVALTLIKQHQAFILEATSVADICERFKEITRGSFVTECHTFMQVSVWGRLCSAAPLAPSALPDPPPPGAPQQLPLLLGRKPHDGLQGGRDPHGTSPGSLGRSTNPSIRHPVGALPLLLASLVPDGSPWPQ